MIPATGESAHDIFRLVQTGGAFGLFGDLIADFPDVIYQFVLGLFYFVNSVKLLPRPRAISGSRLPNRSTAITRIMISSTGPGVQKPKYCIYSVIFSLLITQSRYYNAI